MNLNQLLYFYHVVRTGSYSRAAEEVGISEPAIHRTVATLQRSCGIKLLQRKGKVIEVTPEAEALFEYASRIASLSGMAQQAIAEQKTHISGKLSIGAGVSAVLHMLPAVLPRWAAEHPMVEVSIKQGMGHELQMGLLDGSLDLIVSAGTKWEAGLRRELVFSDRLVVVSAPGHAFSQRELVTVADLSKEKLILTPRGTLVRDEVEEVERRYGVQFKVAAEVNRIDVAKPLCRAGMGLGVLMMSAIAGELAHGELSVLNVEGFPRSCPYFLVYRTDRALTPEMKSMFYAIQVWVSQMDRSDRDSALTAPERSSMT
ncbi:MAG: LysR family transcriptional regulator [Chloroflexi bacterium]|nr:LysR family transcriptional regulator [Chloroflexota bacterium]